MLTLYGIGSCDSCRKARKWLQDQAHDYNFHDLRENGLDADMLSNWATFVGWQVLLNTRSRTWRDLPQAAKSEMTEDRALALMLEHPTLVKRPVLESSARVVVGFSAERYQDLCWSVS